MYYNNNKCVMITVFLVIATICTIVSSQESLSASNGIPTACLGCLCEAVSNCNRTLGCSGDICGLFHITWGYWSDGGKPTQPGEAPDSPTAFKNCVTEPFCAARAVQGYMAKFQTDCNLDGKIDCVDYAYIHKFGGYGCRGTLPEAFGQKLFKCLNQIGAA